MPRMSWNELCLARLGLVLLVTVDGVSYLSLDSRRFKAIMAELVNMVIQVRDAARLRHIHIMGARFHLIDRVNRDSDFLRCASSYRSQVISNRDLLPLASLD